MLIDNSSTYLHILCHSLWFLCLISKEKEIAYSRHTTFLCLINIYC